jgi:hypothetical protein
MFLTRTTPKIGKHAYDFKIRTVWSQETGFLGELPYPFSERDIFRT